MWWFGKQLLFKPAQEIDYSTPMQVSKLGLGVMGSGALQLGQDIFQMKYTEAQEFAKVVQRARSQMAVPVMSRGTSTADELEKLADLRDRGVLTPEEFAAKKQELL
jgi:hypothetical protein